MTPVVRRSSRCCWRWIVGSRSLRRGSSSSSVGWVATRVTRRCRRARIRRARRRGGAARIARVVRRAGSLVMRGMVVSCCRRGRSTSSSTIGRRRVAAATCSSRRSGSRAGSRRVIRSRSCRRSRCGSPSIAASACAARAAALSARASCRARSPAARSGHGCRRRSRHCRCAIVSRAVTWSSSARSCSARGSRPARSTRSSTVPVTRSRRRTTSCSAGCAARRALNVDETGWRLKGGQRTLWGAFTEKIAVFKVTANRHERHLRELLADHQGIVTSDRWWAYDHLPLRRRQVCWSHLQRDFQAQAEGSGAEAGARPGRAADLRARLLGLGGLPAHPRPPRAPARDPRPAPRAQADPAASTAAKHPATSAAAASRATCSKPGPPCGRSPTGPA